MTTNPPPKPKKTAPPSRPVSNNYGDEAAVSKPYELITFPREKPPKNPPIGHDKYRGDRLHGTLFLTLKVQTSLHVSTGVSVMGSDIGSRVPLIKTMVQNIDQKLSIQGSSLKGCIRSTYEAITNSTLGVITNKKEYNDKYPEERLPSTQHKERLCPASQVFGASGNNWGWQGLIEFSDANCEKTGFATGFMPNLWSPRLARKAYFDERGKVAGRKFYYHTIRAIDKGQNRGITVQQAAKEYTFTTKLQFKNLKPEELGTLLIVLGQDPKYPIALKVGGGKPIGMGTMTVAVTAARVLQNKGDLVDRYSSYNPPESDRMNGTELQQFMQKNIQAAHSSLVQATQLQQLAEVLKYPTDREPPTGMY